MTDTTAVLDRLRDGETLADIARDIGMKRPTLHFQLHTTPELVDAYARARESGLHARAERLAEKAATPLPMLQSGGIDPAAVSQLKLEIDTEKWLISKLVPHVYGDRQHIEHSGEVGIAEVLREAKAKRKGGA